MLADPDFYRIGYARSMRVYGVEFREGPDGFGVYASRDVEPRRRARVNFPFLLLGWFFFFFFLLSLVVRLSFFLLPFGPVWFFFHLKFFLVQLVRCSRFTP